MSKTYEKDLVKQLGFFPKEKESGIFRKKYTNGYVIEIDFDKKIINYGKDIKFDSKTTQNFSQAENFVVLECVDRLLEKGYKPKDIVLEKTYPTGHNTSGRLDVLVKKESNSYLMIECKTYGEEFDKELKNTQKNGGQIFTYFQQDTKTELLMLYASKLEKNKIISNFRIINIEEDFRNAGSVEKVFNLWNGKFYEKGFWENPPYGFQLEKITKADLRELTEDEGKKLFHGFATILRKHSVSDKPNAFNIIFNLFLAKLYDEQGGDEDELRFQWKSNDDPVDFQVRLYNLHKEGLFDFLKKEIEGIEDFKTTDEIELKKQQKKFLKFNKLFDIKSVFNDDDFEQNHRVLKEVVKLIEKYKIRYPRKQKYLSEFFELLLTTGLKQESGQYFTPPPIAKFIVKSLPLSAMIKQEIDQLTPKLPAVIDYAAGSGHFITEIMEEYQDIIDNLDISSLHYPNAKTKARTWSKDNDPYSWAASYVYGIEKDYRLVKVAKVGCYFYGDGLAQVIHGDGLDSFEKSKSYIGLLKENTPKKPQFSVVVSNPPYSVSDCKDDLEYIGSQNDFELYKLLTDKSKEIECLFVERTKQLLKEGGVAGVILPSSILSNEGIYTKTREIILQYFDIVAITQLGGNTFMATGTNTVVLFLRRRNDLQIIQLKETIEAVFDNLRDCTVNGIENAVSLYIKHIWNGVSLSDYKSFIQKKPNEKIKKHGLYKEYRPKEYTLEDFTNGDTSAIAIEYAEKQLKKINEAFWIRINNLEKEKFFYFVLTYKQKIVLIKTGEKDEEKRFLGYEFSGRRGNEGIHPIQGGKTIDECTRLFDEKIFNNPEKASTYIYKAFNGNYDFPIHESLKNNISRVNLVDMLNFDRANFEKNISMAVKKKVTIETKWDTVTLNKIVSIVRGASPRPIREYITEDINGVNWIKIGDVKPNSKYITETKEKITIEGANKSRYVKRGDFILSNSMSFGRPYIMEIDGCIHDGWLLLSDFSNKLNKDYLYYILSDNIIQEQFIDSASGGTSVDNLNIDKVSYTKIPLPPKEIQEKIVAEIETLDKKEAGRKKKIEFLKDEIKNRYIEIKSKFNEHILSNEIEIIGGGTPNTNNPEYWENGKIDWLSIVDFKGDTRFVETTEKKITELGLKNSSTKLLNAGDIIISARGTVGELAQLKKPMAFNQSCYGIKAKSNIDANFLYYALKFEIEQFKNNAYGAIFDTITTKTFDLIKIPLPPLSDQQKIVAEIEKIEVQIQDLQKELEQLSIQKGLVLKKYL